MRFNKIILTPFVLLSLILLKGIFLNAHGEGMSNIKKLSLIPLVILVSYVNITNAATGDDQGTVHFKGTVINHLVKLTLTRKM